MFKDILIPKTILFVFTIFVLNACGGGSGADNEPVEDTPNNNNPGNVDPGNVEAQFDLSEYLFNEAVTVTNGEHNYTERFFSKETGDQVFIDLSTRFTSDDTGFISEFSNDDLIRTYSINSTEIEETIIGDDENIVRHSTRFVDIGDNYLNADNTSTIDGTSITQNASCVLLEHLDTFDLSMATDNFSLTSGVYNDVLKIECVTSFVVDGALSPHTTIRSYHAREEGLIFSEGTLFLFGDVYIIEEF